MKDDAAIVLFWNGWGLRIRDLLLGVQKGKDAPTRRRCRAEAAHHACQRGEGLGKTPGVLQHGLDVAHGDLPRNGPKAADGGADHISHVIDQGGDGADGACGHLGLAGTVPQGLIQRPELLLCLLLVVEGLDHLLTVVHLLHIAVQAA